MQTVAATRTTDYVIITGETADVLAALYALTFKVDAIASLLSPPASANELVTSAELAEGGALSSALTTEEAASQENVEQCHQQSRSLPPQPPGADEGRDEWRVEQSLSLPPQPPGADEGSDEWRVAGCQSSVEKLTFRVAMATFEQHRMETRDQYSRESAALCIQAAFRKSLRSAAVSAPACNGTQHFAKSPAPPCPPARPRREDIDAVIADFRKASSLSPDQTYVSCAKATAAYATTTTADAAPYRGTTGPQIPRDRLESEKGSAAPSEGSASPRQRCDSKDEDLIGAVVEALGSRDPDEKEGLEILHFCNSLGDLAERNLRRPGWLDDEMVEHCHGPGLRPRKLKMGNLKDWPALEAIATSDAHT